MIKENGKCDPENLPNASHWPSIGSFRSSTAKNQNKSQTIHISIFERMNTTGIDLSNL